MKTQHTYFRLATAFAVAVYLGMTTTAKSQMAGEIPLIQIRDIPITMAIENFAQQASLNFIVDPKLFKPPGGSGGKAVAEPKVSLNWTNMSASDALARLLKENGLFMVKDPFTTVTRITDTNQVGNVVDVSLLGSSTNNPAQMTNAPVPLMQFMMVPLDVALKNLIEQGQINAVLDPKLAGYFDPVDRTFHNFPMVSLRWENLTAKQAIVALCQNYDLIIVKDAATGIISIKPRG